LVAVQTCLPFHCLAMSAPFRSTIQGFSYPVIRAFPCEWSRDLRASLSIYIEIYEASNEI
jgi:hypothetical protein